MEGTGEAERKRTFMWERHIDLLPSTPIRAADQTCKQGMSPWPGIEPKTLQSVGRHTNHWATGQGLTSTFQRLFSPDSILFSHACTDHYSAKTLRRISLLIFGVLCPCSFLLFISSANSSCLGVSPNSELSLIQWDHWTLNGSHLSLPCFIQHHNSAGSRVTSFFFSLEDLCP